jgi:hypothetical protein
MAADLGLAALVLATVGVALGLWCDIGAAFNGVGDPPNGARS